MKEKDYQNKRTTYTEYPTRLLFLLRGMERLEKLGFPKRFSKNQIILKQGDPLEYCYIVKKGRIISFEYTATGEERVYNFMEEGSLLMEANLIANKPSPVSFKTTMQSELICIDRDSLLRAMEADHQISLDIIESISNKFFASMDQVRQNCSHNAAWKICNLLLIFADRFGVPYDGKILIKEKVSQQMLSNLLAINRITTVRIMKNLKDLALIEHINGYYCICDTGKLKRHQEMLDTMLARH
jgi:CRP/FNR family transcriptional regulator